MADWRDNKWIEGFLEALYSFLELSPCAKEICSTLYFSGERKFTLDKKFRSQFEYADITKKKAISELRKSSLIIRRSRGKYELSNLFLPEIYNMESISLTYCEKGIIVDVNTKRGTNG